MPTLQSLRGNNFAPGFAPSSAARYPWRAVYIGATIFGLMILAYAGMEFGYAPYLEAKRNALQEKQREVSAQITPAQEEDLILFYSQLTNLQKLLSEHARPSASFTMIEQITLPQVQYGQMSLIVSEQKLSLLGTAFDFLTVAQQAQQYINAREVDTVFLKKTQRDKGLATFDIDVRLNPDALRYSSVQ